MTHQPIRLYPLRSLLLMVAACGIACSMIAAAAAQGGRGGFNRGGGFGGGGGFNRGGGQDSGSGDRSGGGQRPAYSVQNLDLIDETLVLDDGQQEIVRAFLDTYTQRFTEINAESQDEMEFVREEMRNASREDDFDRSKAFEQFRTRREKFDIQREEAAAEFVAGLQSVLSDDQMQRWPQFERTMRRIQLVPRGTLSGENVDLFKVVENAGLSDDQQTAVRPLLDEYEQVLDAALQQRESELSGNNGGQGGFFRAIMTGDADVDEIIDDAKRRTKRRVRVRNLNEEYALQIETMLGKADEATAFHNTFREAAYPRVWNETWGEQVFNAALGFDLEQTVFDSIERLATTYFDGLTQRNEKLQRIVREEEPGQAEQRIERFAARMNGADGDRPQDPMREAFSSRSDFEEDMVTQLREYLTQDNLRNLPRHPDPRSQPRTQGRGGGGRGPGGGFGGGRGRDG